MNHLLNQRINEIHSFIANQSLLGKEILTLSEAAIFLGISTSSLYKHTSKRTIPFYKPGKKTIFMKRSELLEWVFSNRNATRVEIESDVANNLMKTKKPV